eukprot:764129-Hanusia_phi.AAC.2
MRDLVRVALSSLLLLLAIIVIPSVFDQNGQQDNDQLSIFSYFEDLVSAPKSDARKISVHSKDDNVKKKILHQKAMARKQISSSKTVSLTNVHKDLNATNHSQYVHSSKSSAVSLQRFKLTPGKSDEGLHKRVDSKSHLRGSEAWERQADDDFFDSLDKNRDAKEEAKRTQIKQRRQSEEAKHQAAEEAEEEKVKRQYLKAKRRFMQQRRAAKDYTKNAFARMDAHQAHLRSDSFVGFKSIEAKELAKEVERDHPNESASQIAARALKLLHVIMKSRRQSPSLPHLDSVGPIGPVGDVQ